MSPPARPPLRRRPFLLAAALAAVTLYSLRSAPAQPAPSPPPPPAPAEDLNAVRKLLQSDSPSDRIRAINMLEGSTSDAATNLLIAELQDFEPNYDRKSPNFYAMEILGQRKEPRAVGPLIGLLAPRTIRVDGKAILWDGSAQAATALGQIGDPKAAAPILGVLSNRLDQNFCQTRTTLDLQTYNALPSPPLPVDAHITALSQLGHAPAATAILKALRATRPVRYLGDGSKPPTLDTAPLYPRTNERRKTFFDALAALPGDPTTAALTDLLITPTPAPSDLKDAEAVLATHKPAAAIAPLLHALADHAKMTPDQLASITRTLTLLTNDPAPGDDPQAWLRWHPPEPPTTRPQ